MVKSFNSNEQRLKRHRRVRAKISGTAQRPRLNVFRFDRGGYLYHGRVKELADGARESGLKF